MKKTIARVFSALACFCILFFSAVPDIVEGMEVGTTVSIIVNDFTIESQTEDCVIPLGGTQELMVGVSQTVISYNWEISTDGGYSWTPLAVTPTYTINSAVPNTPADVAYQYRITVTNAFDSTAVAIIKVLVSNDYTYRTIALRNGDTDVSSYMHDQTRLVVTPLSQSSEVSNELKAQLSEGCLPLIICDISLVNQNNQVVPYFGALQVDFHVGNDYNEQTLKVCHLTDGQVISYYSIVSNGILSIIVESLSPFMVEIPAEDTCAVTVNAGEGGSVVPYGAVNVASGSDRTVTFLPDAGYEVCSVTVNNVPVSFTGNSLTLSNITENKTVFVSFRHAEPLETLHTVTVNTPAHGMVYPSGEIVVKHGFAQTVYFYPDANYELNNVFVNGDEVNVIGNSYTLSAVTGDIVMIANFRYGTSQPPNIYKTIAASAGIGGSISPIGDTVVEYGGNMYFYFIPNDGYEVDEVFIDGNATSVGKGSYRFVNVVAAHTIDVTFRQKPTLPPFIPQPLLSVSQSLPPSVIYRTITAGAGKNGNISPVGSVVVTDGASQTFYMIADNEYEVEAIYVNGVKQNVAGSQFTVEKVTQDMKIHVVFKPIDATVSIDSPHCFICDWIDRDIHPWCWLIPLTIVITLGGVLWFGIHRRRK